MTKPAQSKLRAGCSEQPHEWVSPRQLGAIPAVAPGAPGVAGEAEVQLLGAEPSAGTIQCCHLLWHGAERSPTTPYRQAASRGAGHKGLAAASGLAAPGKYFIFSVQ